MESSVAIILTGLIDLTKFNFLDSLAIVFLKLYEDISFLVLVLVLVFGLLLFLLVKEKKKKKKEKNGVRIYTPLYYKENG
jgi:ABC-type amino acid transport system permease subunit